MPWHLPGRGGGWPLAAAMACGVLAGRYLLARRPLRPGPRPVPLPPEPGERMRARAPGQAPARDAGLLAGDQELLRLADREDAWW